MSKPNPTPDSNDPHAVTASPNHASNAQAHQPKRSRISAERARKRLIQRHGYEEDELRTLFPTDEKLLDFYHEVARSKISDKTEKEIGWDADDNFDAPDEDKSRFADADNQDNAARYKQALPKANQGSGKDVVPTEEEFKQAGEDLKKFLASEDEEI